MLRGADGSWDMNRWKETRRRFVSGAVGASIVGLAGCGGSPGTGVEDAAEEDGAGAETTAAEPTEGETTEAETETTEEPTTEAETAETETTEEGTAGAETTEAGGADAEEELPEGVSEEEFVFGPVPEEYRTATSQADEQRDPDDLQSKESVRFQEASEAEEAGLITPGPNCGNCAEYIPDVNGDGFGACARVEGYIDPEDWCVLWESIEEAEAEGS